MRTKKKCFHPVLSCSNLYGIILLSTHGPRSFHRWDNFFGVFDVNSPSKIKNPNFNAGLKNMTKLVRIGTGWQWPSL